MAYYPLQDRMGYHNADMELVALFYEILSPDISRQPEFWDYRTALHRSRVDLMKKHYSEKRNR